MHHFSNLLSRLDFASQSRRHDVTITLFRENLKVDVTVVLFSILQQFQAPQKNGFLQLHVSKREKSLEMNHFVETFIRFLNQLRLRRNPVSLISSVSFQRSFLLHCVTESSIYRPHVSMHFLRRSSKILNLLGAT